MKESVIIFGVGKNYNKLKNSIMEEYNISFYVDNNNILWGKRLGGYDILSPDALVDNTEKIIVTTDEFYFRDIYFQLEEKGIGPDRILFAKYSSIEDRTKYYSCEITRFSDDNTDLVEYDLYRNPMDDGSGVLLLCSFHSVYPVNLIRNIKRRYNTSISLLTNSADYKEELNNLVNHLYCYDTYVDLYNLLNKLPVYETIHALWIENPWAIFYKEIKKKCKQLLLFVGGSDLYRASKKELDLKKGIIKSSNNIAVEMETVREDFLKVFPGNEDKIILLRYGLEYIERKNSLPSNEHIRKDLGIKSDKVIITCGHNAGIAHQHKKMIEAIQKLDPRILDKAVFVFPMTYGDPSGEYIREIKKILDVGRIEYRILNDFLEYYELAEYIAVSDIMIHVQTTDALSTTMLEHMYSGSIIIAGNWLPYKWLNDIGVYFLTVDSINELTNLLRDIIQNIEIYKDKCNSNSEIIYNISSWEKIAPKWSEIWGNKTN